MEQKTADLEKRIEELEKKVAGATTTINKLNQLFEILAAKRN